MGGPLNAIIGRYPSAAGGGEDELGAGGIIMRSRRCQDLVFLVLFAAFWVATIVDSSFGFNLGNPLRLTYELELQRKHLRRQAGMVARMDLHQLELNVRYWMNPKQVYQSGLKVNLWPMPNPSDGVPHSSTT